MTEILVSENVAGAAMDRLRAEFATRIEPELWRDPAQLIGQLAGVRALIVRNQTRVTRELLAAAPSLEVVGRAGVGLDNVDLAAASEFGVVVALTPEQNSISVAELVIGLILSLARRIPAADRDTRQGGWKRQVFTGIEIHGRRLGVVGLGRIGAATAARARALGMEIVAYDPLLDGDSLRAMECGARLLPLEEVLATSDFVTCHLPETPLTAGLFNAARFALMRPTAYFINTARGGVVDEPALLAALQSGALAGAALDVRATEPPPSDALTAALSGMDNVILLPHIGAFTVEGQRRVVNSICRDVSAVLRGEPAQFYANFPRPIKTGGR
ncbi:MAG: hydroxyacid dehydrogenase [Acidobacteriota bacterium]|jgi:D-3-phosphoglycerate dehydrogenase